MIRGTAALLVLQVTWAQSGYWWMGQSGSFGGTENLESGTGGYAGVSSADNVVENDQRPEKLQKPQPSGGYSGGGYGNSVDNTVPESTETDLQQALASLVNNVINERNSNYGADELPTTECAVGWKCVNEIFCDETGTMVAFRVELTQQQKRNRGQLIPCMNQALGKFEVCCKKPPTTEILVETVESLPAGLPIIDPAQSTQQSSKQSLPPSPSSSSSPSSCPALGPLPPISACAGRQSNCWSVGVRDLDCLDSALCCFDGCANVCLGRGPIAGNPGPQSNPRLPTTIQEIIAPPTQTQDASATNNLLPVDQQQDEQQSDFVFPEPEQENNEAFGLPSPTQQFLEYDEVQDKKDQNTDTSLAKQTLNDVLSNQEFESNAPSKLSPEQLSTTSTPYVQCPSAMKCVPRVNCDFNGVMVNYNVILSQAQEEQRVPLIVSLFKMLA